VIAWDGSATDVVSNDKNDALDVFVVTVSTAPTFSLSTNSVPESSSTTFATVSTSSTSTFTYSFTTDTTGTGLDTDNGQFSIDSTTGQLTTAANFPTSTSQTFKILVRATDTSTSATFDTPFTLTLVTKPTAITPTLINDPGTTLRVPATPD